MEARLAVKKPAKGSKEQPKKNDIWEGQVNKEHNRDQKSIWPSINERGKKKLDKLNDSINITNIP